MTGTITKIKNTYGFIKALHGDVFFHASECTEDNFGSLSVGDKVEFSIKENARGNSAVGLKKV